MSILIVDTGCANLASVRYAFERLDQQVVLSRDPEVINRAKRVVLPGVGSAKAAMSQIQARELEECLQNLTQPTLGICLGMQLMSDYSEESNVDCLGVIPTRIEPFAPSGLPLPHMGWNRLSEMQHPIFTDVADGAYVYFVHGFIAPVGENTVAQSDYGLNFSAAIAKDNYIGLQFHPERSAEVGAQMLKNFIRIDELGELS
ncbi:imidazole glycerol phosphate synthase subunit HisH [Paraferrimonas sedimenticola]|uniref:Imidazole glycerol phosphate synthase subunit HisH n=1 Tax=Paraferrimonas sedimenticola TaxID=375674 RepID=A0AA37RWD1_9GAMM|nr:imidazole glycerol phosphate synthase subunit HisH [Paraferrimonas sedimenticola]GLP96516.1 imidazole glycerol phosphate synthase subunit HisH [Paraferrimonas sedimenticola]